MTTLLVLARSACVALLCFSIVVVHAARNPKCEVKIDGSVYDLNSLPVVTNSETYSASDASNSHLMNTTLFGFSLCHKTTNFGGGLDPSANPAYIYSADGFYWDNLVGVGALGYGVLFTYTSTAPDNKGIVLLALACNGSSILWMDPNASCVNEGTCSFDGSTNLFPCAPQPTSTPKPTPFPTRNTTVSWVSQSFPLASISGSEGDQGVPVSLAVSRAGDIVFVGLTTSTLAALNSSTGETLWTTTLDTGCGHGISTPLVVQARNGTDLVAITAGTHVYVYDASKKMNHRWTYQTYLCQTGYLSFSDDVLAVGSTNGHVTALNVNTGKANWIFSANYQPGQPPGPTSGYRKVYFIIEGFLIAMDQQTGARSWNVSCSPNGQQPVVSDAVPGGLVIVTDADKISIVAYSCEDGAVVWQRTLKPAQGSGAVNTTAVALVQGDMFWFQSWLVYCINATNGQVVWFDTTGDYYTNGGASAVPKSFAVGTVNHAFRYMAGFYPQAAVSGVPTDFELYMKESLSGYPVARFSVPSLASALNLATSITVSTCSTVSYTVVGPSAPVMPFQSLYGVVLCNNANVLVYSIGIPNTETVTDTDCQDLQCSQSCVTATHDIYCAPVDWSVDAYSTPSKAWINRRCYLNHTELTRFKINGGSCATTASYKTSQFVGQCVIREGQHSSTTDQCGGD